MTFLSEVLDFNRANLSATDISTVINKFMDDAALSEQREDRRSYLGASAIGSECLRKIQFDWMRDSIHPARTKRIFERGHMFEEITVQALQKAGFCMERGTPATVFTAAEGMFRGHADGIIVGGPPVLIYPCLFEHKALGSSGWKKLEKHGLRQAYPQYEMQVSIYQAYLGLDQNPALFTAVNSDTCEVLHLLVPFDAEVAQAASDRAVAVIKATQSGEMLPRITDKGPTDWRCKQCQHSAFCWSQDD